MQGPTASRKAAAGFAALFAGMFVAAAAVIFATVNAAGVMLGAAALPPWWGLGIAGAGLLLLAAVDVRAITKATYCPIGWRRQTPRILIRRYSIPVVVAIWGFDTGLLVTTFRVAAVSWAALLLSALGLVPRWTGLCYGLGFALPFLVLLCRGGLGRASREAGADPGLEAMLRKRAIVQGLSAAVLVVSSILLMAACFGESAEPLLNTVKTSGGDLGTFEAAP